MSSPIEQFQLTFSASPFLVILAILGFMLFTLFIYRRTNPVVSPALRYLLILLRTLVLMLTVLIGFEFVLHLQYKNIQQKVLAVAIDRSASMSIVDKSGSRTRQLAKIVHDPIFNELQKLYTVKYYSFANDLQNETKSVIDSTDLTGDATNIRLMLEKISIQNSDENLAAILLISDGSYTTGGNPLRFADQMTTPVYALGTGSAEAIADLSIISVDANPLAYVDQPAPIRVKIRNIGFPSISIPFNMTIEGRIISSDNIELLSSPSDIEKTYTFTPETTGRQKIILSIPSQESELSTENNRRTIYIDVMQSKLSIMMICGGITPDITFFKKHLTTDRYQFQLLTHKKNGAYYQNLPSADDLRKIDLFIFYNFPTNETGAVLPAQIRESLISRSRPVLVVCGALTSFKDLEAFADFIPFSKAAHTGEDKLVYPILSPPGLSHAVMQVANDLSDTQGAWSALPPIYSSVSTPLLLPGSEVLAYSHHDTQTDITTPLIAVRSNGLQKSAVIFAHELWRWDLMLRGLEDRQQVLAPFLDNLVRWLEMFRTDDLLYVSTDKPHYHFGDPVETQITVFDEKLHPLSDARIELKLTNQEQESQLFTAAPQGDGKYSATLQPPAPGDFQLEATAFIQERHLGVAKTLFSVGEYSAEFANLPAQLELLKSLANKTGGVYAPGDSLFLLKKWFPGETIIRTSTFDNPLWHNKYLLIILVSLLTLEWLIRKRRGMV